MPRAKVWRAFPEFDSLSDEECLRCLRLTMLNAPRSLGLVPLFCGLMGAAGLAALNIATSAPRDIARLVGNNQDSQLIAEVGAWVIGMVLVLSVAGLVGRDLLYYLCLRRAVRIANCRKCGQSLMGVPIIDTSLHGEPGKARVRCPECGRVWMLLEIGLTPRDLIPLEMRATAKDFARAKRR
jgi:hypothetical protein